MKKQSASTKSADFQSQLIKSKGSRIHSEKSPRIPLLLCILVIAGSVLMFTRGWMDNGVPLEDFPGNVAHIWEIRQNLLSEGSLSQWCPTWFNGQPRTLLFAKFLSTVLPLSLSTIDIIASIKIALILFHLFSGLSMFLFLGDLTRDRGIRTVGAVMYSVHPMAIVESAQRVHMEVAMFYAIVPLIFWMAIRTFRSERFVDSLILGIFLSIGLWINNEGSFVTYPFLLVFLFFSLFEGWSPFRKKDMKEQWLLTWPRIRRKCLCLLVALGTSLGLCAFFWFPVIAERHLYNLFDPSYIENAIRDFSFRNVFYAINRDNALFAHLRDLSPSMKTFGAHLYVGVVPLLFACLGLAFRRGDVHSTRFAWFVMGWVAFVLSFGGFSLISTLDPLVASAD